MVSSFSVCESENYRFWLELKRDCVELNKVIINEATLGFAV